MKIKIEKEFRDKYTGEKYIVGSEVEFEADRANELLSDPRNLVSEVVEVEKPKKSTKRSKK